MYDRECMYMNMSYIKTCKWSNNKENEENTI